MLEHGQVGVRRIVALGRAPHDPIAQRRLAGGEAHDRKRNLQFGCELAEQIALPPFEKRRIDDGEIAGSNNAASQCTHAAIRGLGRIGRVQAAVDARHSFGRPLGVHALALDIGADTYRAEPLEQRPRQGRLTGPGEAMRSSGRETRLVEGCALAIRAQSARRGNFNGSAIPRPLRPRATSVPCRL